MTERRPCLCSEPAFRNSPGAQISPLTGHSLACPGHYETLAGGGSAKVPVAVEPPKGDPDCHCNDRTYANTFGGARSAISGHLLSCPVHRRIFADYRPMPDPDGPVDRGTPVWIWRGPWHEFYPFPQATHRFEVSVPIGWSLHADESRIFVLVNVFGERLSAADVWFRAEQCRDGFRIRWQKDV